MHYRVCANISLKSIASITDENGEQASEKMNNRTIINLNSSPVSNFISNSLFCSHFSFSHCPCPPSSLRSQFYPLLIIPVSLLRPELQLDELLFRSETPFSFFLGRKRFLFRRFPKKSLLLLYFIFYLRLFLFFFCFNYMILHYHSAYPSQKKN